MKVLPWIVFLSLFFNSPAWTYRFVCNGFLANGEERAFDGCGACNVVTAARWENPHIPLVIDKNPRPSNISIADWQNVVRESLRAWDKTPGTSLKFVEVESENPREFGSNDRVHEIFWITDPME